MAGSSVAPFCPAFSRVRLELCYTNTLWPSPPWPSEQSPAAFAATTDVLDAGTAFYPLFEVLEVS